MGQKILIGPMERGLRNDRSAFTIDNESFPTLVNAYQWRGRIKRKRGTSLLGRLQRFFDSDPDTITLDGSGNGNLITGFSLQSDASIVPGTIIIVDTISATVYTDPSMDGTLSPSGTINYASGDVVIAASAGNTITASFTYYPTLPVMGLEDLILEVNQFPGTLAFDTTFSYNIPTSDPYTPYDVSFYKNPTSGTYPGYVQKTDWTPTTWNGQDYQQFWTVNYQGALFATNGIDIPFTGAHIGMQFKNVTFISAITPIGGPPPTTVQVTIPAHGLVVGDFLFFNEFDTTIFQGLNFQTGYVITRVNNNNVIVEFPNATITGPAGATATSQGIAQYLTNRSDTAKDCLRWYDGDPTDGISPLPSTSKGWVNFAPPLSQSSFSIDDEIASIYYLVGARMIVPFKDRLLFLGPVIQSSTGSPLYLQDTIIYSQNGTTFYTCSYTNDPDPTLDTPTSPTITFTPILVPDNQTASPAAYFEDATGFGGFVSAGVDQPLVTVSPNEDVLICGFDRLQTRLIYSGNDIIPFSFFLINSELGSSSTFSVINMDEGVITRGNRGFVITSQTDCKRIDLEIPDQVFEIILTNNGTERVCSQRDFINEWIYFTYVSNDDDEDYVFPDQTLQFNYRDNSWAIFNESYTNYGQFRPSSGLTWNTVDFDSWNAWTDPWDAGQTILRQPQIIGGNQQGFILFRAVGTNEGNSLAIQNISGSTITSPNHGLNEGDYIIISEVLGTVGSEVNNKIFSVVTPTVNDFVLDPSISSGTYIGSGLIKRMYVPFIQTKQFPTGWEIARKVRLGPQQYLLTTTANAQITLLIFLGQNSAFAYNESVNDGLIYSTILYTCPESTNLGLTPFNTNLQMLAEPQTGVSPQAQIWHRVNTSLLGDTVQLGFTLSDSQMRTVDEDGSTISQFAEIDLQRIILDVSPSGLLA